MIFKHTIIAGAAFLAVLCGAARADFESDIKACLDIAADDTRLACYDVLALDKIPNTTSTDTSANWLVHSSTSKITDDTNVFLLKDSTEPVSCSWSSNSFVTLVLRCVENTTALVFNTECHMTSSRYSNYGNVDIRLDNNKARTISMDSSTDNKALGLWSGGEAIPVIKSMFGKQTMVARMMPFGGNAFTVTFDISGLEESIRPLRNACHW